MRNTDNEKLRAEHGAAGTSATLDRALLWEDLWGVAYTQSSRVELTYGLLGRKGSGI